MGEHASQVQARLRDRLAAARLDLDWRTEYDLDGTRVDVAGVSESTLVLVELVWRRADPVDNTATRFRHLATRRGDGSESESETVLAGSSDRRVVVVQPFIDHYDLVRGGVSSKRKNAEFVGDPPRHRRSRASPTTGSRSRSPRHERTATSRLAENARSKPSLPTSVTCSRLGDSPCGRPGARARQ
jgi:hypothetical protein